ncbi:hypothetical protein GA0070606_4719 [Micromonospora citrea]|uniref:VOC domain-containing protein n=1 Tax=Micromonospora citrea TaxID=47855 RepID=A0A1C6VPJ5_9ACTN|nr:VOC family protein [Micromonospora citrea]SCL68137.1 hypothetical protein GA0070606_4719 [Micromonospora citrea]
MTEIPSNMVTWFQLPADDVERAWSFYKEAFGWSRDAAYANVAQPGAINGEIAQRTEELHHPRLVIRVDDLDEALRKITEAGGRTIVHRTEIPAIAMVFATFMDTEGNSVNIVSDLRKAAG